jgi:uncharacterized protein (TIRG00374 family)
MAEGGRTARRWLVRAIAATSLTAAVWWGVHDLSAAALIHALARAAIGLLLLAALANLLALAVQAWRWLLLLRPLGRPSYPQSLGTILVGFALSSIMPARAGEVARVHLMARRMNVGRATIAGTAVLDHVVNGLTFAPLTLIIPFSSDVPDWMQRGTLLLLSLAAAAGIAAWVTAAPVGTHQEQQGRLRKTVTQLREGFAAARSPGRFGRALALGVLAWVLEGLTTWLTLQALGISSSPAVVVIVLLAVNVALAVPAPPGNLGTFELGAVLALTALGIRKEAAVAFGLCYHGVQLVPLWIAGIPAWLFLRHDEDNGQPLMPAGNAPTR